MSSAKRDRAYWFYLEPFVHVSIKKRKLLLYNTLNGKALEYENEPETERIVKQLLSKKNLLVIKLTGRDIKDNPPIDRFVDRVITFHMGDLLDASLSSEKPIQLLPVVNVQRDVNRLKKDPSRSVGEYILNYLDELSFYINNRCEHERKIFYDGFKQFLFVIKGSGRRKELKLADIAKLLDEARGSTLSRVNILGGNVFHYPEFKELVSSLGISSYSFQPYFNGRNLAFFKKHVFVNKQMVLASKPPLEEILARQVVNAVSFGRVTVLPDGNVFANVNAKRIGRLGRDSLDKMLYHEMYHGRSWRRVRGKVMPCKECVYERLCPPLSNYEYALGRNNVCHTWRESN